MINTDLRNQLLLYLFVFGSVFTLQAQSVEEGKELWNAKGCAACHAKDMKTDLTGPALAGVRDRWENQEDLYNWVRNSQEMIKSGHEYGNALFEKYNKVQMLPFPDLTDEQVESLLLYIEDVAAGGGGGSSTASNAKSTETVADDYDEDLVNQGKELFNAKGCMACHSKDMKTDLTGPALSGVEDRWENRDELFNWIRNSQEMIANGHEYGNQLFEKYNKVQMLPYPDLTDEEIEALLAYIKYPDGPPAVAEETVAAPKTMMGEEKPPFYKRNLFYILLFLIAGAVVTVLAKTVADLKNQAYEKEFGEQGPHTVLSVLISRSLLKFATFAFVVFGVYFTAIKAMNLGRQQNYEPEQPIVYSHKTHAGVNQIDCQFCHDGSRRSKNAMIPGTNTCMKCHIVIKNGTEYGTEEITKIFVSAGYDPTSNSYIENYDELNESDLEKIYKKWIEKMNPDFDSYKVNKQWEDIVDALTNEQKRKVQGPIEWIKIHNLPDHVYFNHAQHVTVGKLECQQCHGPIQEMEVVRQYSPLSMGWCVNCHRETKVQFEGNPYYKNYAKYHEEIIAGTRDSVTVQEIGGISCQKCHY